MIDVLLRLALLGACAAAVPVLRVIIAEALLQWRVYLIEEAPAPDPRLVIVREYVSDPEDAVALLARLDEVSA